MEFYVKNDEGAFVTAGYKFDGFPSDGFWIVKDGSRNCILRLDEEVNRPPPYMDYMRHKEDIMNGIYAKHANSSLNEMVDYVLEYLASKVEYEKHI